MTKPRPVRVVVVRNHVRLFYGQIYMHSEEYASHAGAKRAAKGLVRAINASPMTLEYTHRGNWVVQTVRKLWASGRGVPVSMPIEIEVKAYPPYFDPALEGE